MPKGGSGKGKSGGGGGIGVLPDEANFAPKSELPQLTGTNSQISYAESVRSKTLSDLQKRVVSESPQGNPTSKEFSTASKTKKGMEEYINNNNLVKSTEGNLKQEKINNIKESFAQRAKQVKRFNEITKKTNSNFWLDNKDIYRSGKPTTSIYDYVVKLK